LEVDSSSRKTILTMVGYYIPGYKAGGPIRSISNVVEALGDEFDFLILTSDRDLRAPCPYEGIPSETWLPVGKAMVMYLSIKGLSFWNILELLRSTKYDLIYLNSFFARRFSMIPCFLTWSGVIPKKPIILAPRGEFSKGAMKIKYWRKIIYMRVVKILGVYKNIIWHASSIFEKEDILNILNAIGNISIAMPVSDVNPPNLNREVENSGILIAMDIPDRTPFLHDREREKKISGSIKLCFLSRISPMKNLDVAIELLDGLEGDIQYNIYGPIQDKAYWNRCEKRIETMPDNIRIEYKGEVPYEQARKVFSMYHFFLFPTRGENYGHVIMESLLAGCPVIISAKTPWRNLEGSGVGWDLPLEDRHAFREVLQKCIVMGADEYAKHSTLAKEYAVNRCMHPEVLEQSRSLFRKALGDET